MLNLGSFDQPRQSAGEALRWPQRFAELASSATDIRLESFYRAGTVDGETPLAAVPMAALDVETTGLDLRSDEIVSIGVIPMSLDCICSSRSRHWIVRPRRRMSADAVRFHRITHSQVEMAPDLAEVVPALLELLAGRVVVVHGRAIERGFIDAAVRERLGESLQFPVIDTMELEARVHRATATGLLARLIGRKPVSIRLADARKRFGLPRYRPHHALTDALAAAELLLAQIAHRFTPDTPIRDLWQ